MSRRIEVELTSTREDGTWTWRAAGAKQPKGELDGGLLYSDAKVGDVVRADADFLIDGIVVTAVLPPRGARKEPERIEVLGSPRKDDQLVTTTLAPKGRGDRGDRRDRGDRGDRPPRDRGDRRPRGDGDRAPRGDGQRRPRSDASDRPPRSDERRARPPRPAPEAKPKPKRLRAGRTHRAAVLAALPEEQRPVAEQVLRGGIPAVRQAVEKQNEANKAEGKPEISPAPLMALAEQLVPPLRTAEWHDKADAALADVAELDLRDLRSVVVAADAGARDEETRELAERLRTALSERVEAEQAAWLKEIAQMLDEGRAVRALRLSSRPPKAGAPFPPELGTRLAEAAAASLTGDTGTERYATVLDALAHSPIRAQVTALGVPDPPGDELLAAVRKLASRLPQIAAEFGIEAPAPGARPSKGRPRPKGKGRPVPPPPPRSDSPPNPAEPDAGSPGERPPATPDAPVASLDAGDAPVASLDAGDAPVASLDAGDAPVASLDAGDAPVASLDAGDAPVASLDAGDAPVEPSAPESSDASADQSTEDSTES